MKKIFTPIIITLALISGCAPIQNNQNSLPASKSAELTRFETAVTYFYQNPTKQNFDSILAFIDNNHALIESRDDPNALSYISAVFLVRVAQKYQWPITGKNRTADMAREIIAGKTKFAQFANDDAKVIPTKLDMWWVSYFATGNNLFLDKILQFAGEKMPEPEDSQYAVIGSATWSFKSNCAQHESIKSYARDCLTKERYAEKTSYLQECINQ